MRGLAEGPTPFSLEDCDLALLRPVATGPGGSGDLSQTKPPAKPTNGGFAAPEVSRPAELFCRNPASTGSDASLDAYRQTRLIKSLETERGTLGSQEKRTTTRSSDKGCCPLFSSGLKAR